MASLMDRITGKSHKNDNTANTSNSSSSSSSMSSNSSSTTGSTASGTSSGYTNPNNTTTTTSQQTTTTSNNKNMNTTGSGLNPTPVAQNNQGMTDDAMTRSEERLRVGKEVMPAGSARLDKYVTTEHVQTSVPVTKERVVVEREPINENNKDAALNGAEISEAHHEVRLTEERALGQKETVPIERIRLGKQQETQQQVVGADLRKEHVDLTTTGINEKFDNVGYGKNLGQPMNNNNMTNESANMTGKNTTSGTTANRV